VYNIQSILQMYSQFRQNPMALLGRRFNIPQGIQSPQDMVQYLLNSGQVSQDQVNQAMRMKNDPQIRNMFR
jgi:hypothetical protein